ncbi:MAG: hypothetical protein K2Q21_10560 [Chitinophagaceae bacterium]|nr:hypothetical protein [Chitinophagaceae bacterium]
MNFFSIPVQTEIKGKRINGLLRGNLVYWEFESYSSFFVQYFPNNIFSSRTTLRDNSDSMVTLVEGLLSAFDKSIEPILA